MRLFLLAGLVAVVAAVCPLAASASIYVGGGNLSGSRSSADTDEIIGIGEWGVGQDGIQIRWVIADNGAPDGVDRWSYTYWISAATDLLSDDDALSKTLSHWLLEISADVTDADFANFSPSHAGFDTYEDDGSNPGLPGDLYGIKWEAPEDPHKDVEHVDGDEHEPVVLWATAMFSFTSSQIPVWGDFYMKDGESQVDEGAKVAAWNTNFGLIPADDEADFSGWIARPNGDFEGPDVTPIPEPSTWLIFSGLAACFGINAWRKKKRTA